MLRRLRRYYFYLSVAILSCAIVPNQAFALPAPLISSQYQMRSAELLKILQGSQKEEQFFAQSFRDAIPVAQFRNLLAQLNGQYGEPVGIKSIAATSEHVGTIEVLYEKAVVSIKMVIDSDAPHPVIGLLVTGATFYDDDFANISSEIAALPGVAGFQIVDISGGTMRQIEGQNANQQFAIGSVFKLYVLAELGRSIQADEKQWDDVVPLTRKSLPSGVLQNWPDNSPLTLHTLATLMISISDNSATDILISHLGRANIGNFLRLTGHSDPARALPLLSTLEAFALKMEDNRDLRQAYTSSSEAEQAALLANQKARLGLNSLSIANLATNPRHIDMIEWYAAPTDVNKLLLYLNQSQDPAIQSILAINPIIPPGDALRWRYLGGKGGSEPGVVSFAFIAKTQTGKTYVVSGSWNNAVAPVDNQKFLSLISRMLNQLAGN